MITTTIARAGRVCWTILIIVVVQVIVCGAAMFPILLAWIPLVRLEAGVIVHVALYALAAIPSYVGFVLLLMMVSPLVSRLTGARTPDAAQLRLADLDWALMRWARYLVAIQFVRLFAGTLFRGSPLWTAYLRLNGARIGRRVYINSLSLSDHNLLELGDDVVIGADVHLSGHTVEAGWLRTGRVRVGSNVTIGLGSVIDIDVEIASGCEIGAMSLVPKHARITTPGIYAGVPVHPLASGSSSGSHPASPPHRRG